MSNILIKRVYEPVEKVDGFRVFVDRLWPRGMKKETLQMDEWMKEVAPSVTLRKWFNHDTEKWQEFIARYTSELTQNAAVLALLEQVKNHKTITFLYAAHDEAHNHALVLQQFINNALK